MYALPQARRPATLARQVAQARTHALRDAAAHSGVDLK